MRTTRFFSDDNTGISDMTTNDSLSLKLEKRRVNKGVLEESSINFRLLEKTYACFLRKIGGSSDYSSSGNFELENEITKHINSEQLTEADVFTFFVSTAKTILKELQGIPENGLTFNHRIDGTRGKVINMVDEFITRVISNQNHYIIVDAYISFEVLKESFEAFSKSAGFYETQIDVTEGDCSPAAYAVLENMYSEFPDLNSENMQEREIATGNIMQKLCDNASSLIPGLTWVKGQFLLAKEDFSIDDICGETLLSTIKDFATNRKADAAACNLKSGLDPRSIMTPKQVDLFTDIIHAKAKGILSQSFLDRANSILEDSGESRISLR